MQKNVPTMQSLIQGNYPIFNNAPGKRDLPVPIRVHKVPSQSEGHGDPPPFQWRDIEDKQKQILSSNSEC